MIDGISVVDEEEVDIVVVSSNTIIAVVPSARATESAVFVVFITDSTTEEADSLNMSDSSRLAATLEAASLETLPLGGAADAEKIASALVDAVELRIAGALKGVDSLKRTISDDDEMVVLIEVGVALENNDVVLNGRVV